jgi:hypothetical protein
VNEPVGVGVFGAASRRGPPGPRAADDRRQLAALAGEEPTEPVPALAGG